MKKKYSWITKLAEERYRVPESPKGNLTFKEFVLVLIHDMNLRRLDGHWQPYHETCFPCYIRYDFIGHYETMEEDAKYVLEKIGLRNYKFPHYHSSSVPSKSILARELANLSHRDIEKLISIYRLDFRLYGYSNEFQAFTSEIT